MKKLVVFGLTLCFGVLVAGSAQGHMSCAEFTQKYSDISDNYTIKRYCRIEEELKRNLVQREGFEKRVRIVQEAVSELEEGPGKIIGSEFLGILTEAIPGFTEEIEHLVSDLEGMPRELENGIAFRRYEESKNDSRSGGL
ncbi:MAG: hypothetical protein LBT18_04060 [Endomicrobium sp.]|jgi:hypothetical protein|nr:hypothetical protein [Endomicrobium sp.]